MLTRPREILAKPRYHPFSFKWAAAAMAAGGFLGFVIICLESTPSPASMFLGATAFGMIFGLLVYLGRNRADRHTSDVEWSEPDESTDPVMNYMMHGESGLYGNLGYHMLNDHRP